MEQPTSPRAPRPADIAIVCSRMLTGLLRKIWKLSFRQLAPNNMGTSLILMMLSFRIAITTADEDPQTATQLADLVTMPPSTVKRYLGMLVNHHRVKTHANRKRGRGHESVIIFEMNRLDRLMTLKHVDWCIDLIEQCLNEMKRLRELLLPELMANGRKGEAAE